MRGEKMSYDEDDDYDYEYEYFCNQAKRTGYAIASMYRSTVSLIENKLTEHIVNNIARTFYSETAVDCMKTFQWNVNNISDDVAQAFVNLRNQLQSTVNSYEYQRNANRHLTVEYIQYKPITINITKVKEKDDNGNRYIRKNLGIDVEDWIHQCKTEIKSGIRLLADNVPTDLYIWGGQSYAVRYALNQMAGIIDNIFGFLTYGENSIYHVIEDFERDYRKTGENVSSDTSRFD